MRSAGRRRGFLLVAAIACGVFLNVQRSETHKPITSKYTYNDDVFPILRDRCGRCHVTDGVAPMSLMSYKDAFPWGESIRAEVIARHMPPWNAQEGTLPLKNAPTITAAEIDKVLTWVSGGYPEGNLQNPPSRVTLQRDWPMGKPDLVLQLPETILAAGKSEATQEFTVPVLTSETKWVRAADLLPGTASIVRDAIISLKTKTSTEPAQITPERVLAMWVPGDDPLEPEVGTFRLPAGAELVVRVHYRKTYRHEGMEMSDRSSVGLYFADGPSAEIKRLDVFSGAVTANSKSVSFSGIVNEDVQALSVRADPALSNAALQVDVVSTTGVRKPVIRLAVRPNWGRRYWLDQPLALPRGTRIEVVTVLNGADTLLPPAGTPLPLQPVDGSPLRVSFDVIEAGARQPSD